tara:strand:+ start:151 stop:990 length:840 start_codon:yes stop_codon:yes gene_type:complete
MSIQTDVSRATTYLRIVLEEPAVDFTTASFAEQFTNLDSLIFISALAATVRPIPGYFPAGDSPADRLAEEFGNYVKRRSEPRLRPQNRDATSAANDIRARFRAQPADRAYSPEAIDAANQVAARFHVVRVHYASPTDVLFAVAIEVADTSGPIAITGGLVLSSALALVHLWKKISKARHASYDADSAKAEARISHAKAREAEIKADVAESEAFLRLEAHDLVREHLGIARSIYGADSPMSNRMASGPDPTKSVKALDKRLDQAVEALIRIDNAEVRMEG